MTIGGVSSSLWETPGPSGFVFGTVMVLRKMCSACSSGTVIDISVSSPPTQTVKSSPASPLSLALSPSLCATELLLLAHVVLPRCHLFERLISTSRLLQRVCELAACCEGWQRERKTVRWVRSLRPSSSPSLSSVMGRRRMLILTRLTLCSIGRRSRRRGSPSDLRQCLMRGWTGAHQQPRSLLCLFVIFF